MASTTKTIQIRMYDNRSSVHKHTLSIIQTEHILRLINTQADTYMLLHVLFCITPGITPRLRTRADIAKSGRDTSLLTMCYLCVERPRMAPKLWRQSYGAKGMHAFIDYHRSGICYHQMSSACDRRWSYDVLMAGVTASY